MITDVSGNDLQPGDRIAVAFREGNQGTLRIGTIIEFSERKADWGCATEMIEVEWTGEGSNWNAIGMKGKRTKIEAANKKFVRL